MLLLQSCTHGPAWLKTLQFPSYDQQHPQARLISKSINQMAMYVGQVDTMKYLGVMISGDGSMDREVEARIGVHLELLGE